MNLWSSVHLLIGTQYSLEFNSNLPKHFCKFYSKHCFKSFNSIVIGWMSKWDYWWSRETFLSVAPLILIIFDLRERHLTSPTSILIPELLIVYPAEATWKFFATPSSTNLCLSATCLRQSSTSSRNLESSPSIDKFNIHNGSRGSWHGESHRQQDQSQGIRPFEMVLSGLRAPNARRQVRSILTLQCYPANSSSQRLQVPYY